MVIQIQFYQIKFELVEWSWMFGSINDVNFSVNKNSFRMWKIVWLVDYTAYNSIKNNYSFRIVIDL